MEKATTCRICQHVSENRLFQVSEMMFGLRDKFYYFQCSRCGCLQILAIPEDMDKYYPDSYYSFSVFGALKVMNPIEKFAKKIRDNYAVFGKGLAGRIIYRKIPNEALRSLSEISLNKGSRILEVGCGVGSLLFALRDLGFTDLTGIDPYIQKEFDDGKGLKILKKSIHETEGSWDLIMFHHSFEHLADPLETMLKVAKLMGDHGFCLNRVPVVSSFAWEKYREKWVQLDAPRHFFLHTPQSMQILAENSGMTIEKILYDSNAFQFWGSEQYFRDIPLMAENSYLRQSAGSIFSKKEIREFHKQAEHLNQENRGDTAVFILKNQDKKG